ncbi:hypothetical protein [Candidatus Uabimicrobium sp. HlEnr_7]|uniref:hypothetical protein n=1 Tax=Candidatus Uabimicrobium helgolandensis TaxID=3095367 RepID=UPI003558B4BD
MSPVYKRFYREITAGFFIAIATIGLGYLPGDDFLQGIWVFLSTSTAAWIALRTRVRENDEERYSRLAKSYFRHWIKEDPQKVEGLFAANVPYSVIDWFQKEANCNLLKCNSPHVVDSWSKVGDEPGELIFRSGLRLGKMLRESKENNCKTQEFLSKKFSEFAQNGKELLGEEIAPHVFYKKLKKGDYRPVGIHISNSHSECLIVSEKQERQNGESTITINRISLGFKQEQLEALNEEEWEYAKKHIIFQHFPYFKPAQGGSGPQKKVVPLFLTEKNLDEKQLSQFPQLAVQVYNQLKEYTQKIIDKKTPPDTEEQVENEQSNN